MRQTPDRLGSIRQYRRVAPVYDRVVLFRRARRAGVRALAVREGDTVLEVGCGTGINFGALRSFVGERGALIGVDQSADMLGKAKEVVARAGWENVSLLHRTAEEVIIGQPFDAILFSYTHDVLQRPEAIRNILAQAQSGTMVVAVCAVWNEERQANWVTWMIKRVARLYITTFAGMDEPWRHLLPYLESVEIRPSRSSLYAVLSGRTQGGEHS